MNGNLSVSNGLDIKAKLNGHLCEPNGIDIKRLNGHSFESNRFNISANNSLIKKDNDNRPHRNQKFFVKSCDISLDSDIEEPGNSENLRTATQSLLDNLNWDPAELTNKQINNSPRFSEATVKTTTTTTVENGHEVITNHSKPLSIEIENPINGELINTNNNTAEMSNRTFISRRSNSTLHNDDKTDTHKRLIRTSVTQIEKPTLHSRRFSGIEGSNSIDNYIRRKGSTELEWASRNKYNTYSSNDIKAGKRTYTRSQTGGDIESRRYSFEKGNSDNDKLDTSADDFQPKSSFLRQRLKEIDNKQQSQYSREARKYSLGQQNTYDESKVDAFIKSFKERRASESLSNRSSLEVNGDKINATLSETT